MTSYASLCESCTRFNSAVRDRNVCAAFPDGIPDAIITGGLDHRLAIDGDHGLTYDPDPDHPLAVPKDPPVDDDDEDEEEEEA